MEAETFQIITVGRRRNEGLDSSIPGRSYQPGAKNATSTEPNDIKTRK